MKMCWMSAGTAAPVLSTIVRVRGSMRRLRREVDEEVDVVDAIGAQDRTCDVGYDEGPRDGTGETKVELERTATVESDRLTIGGVEGDVELGWLERVDCVVRRNDGDGGSGVDEEGLIGQSIVDVEQIELAMGVGGSKLDLAAASGRETGDSMWAICMSRGELGSDPGARWDDLGSDPRVR